MARILKREPLPHAVVCDTNILWFEDKSPAVSPEFTEFWAKATAKFELTLYVPDIVRGELLFQHFTSCHKLLRSTEDGLAKISSITQISHSTRLTGDKIHRHILSKFEKWIKELRVEILSLPVTKIDWARVAEDAIWRKAPFTADPKNPEVEKGFRDALILETLCEFVKADARKINIAFLSNDHLLRSTALARLKADSRFSAFETVQEFEGYLLLTKERLTNDFIAKILTRARERFYTKADPTCLYFREDMRNRLKTDYKDYFDDTAKSEDRGLASLSFFAPQKRYLASDDGVFWITPPEFLRVENEKNYFWKTIVKFVQPYAEEQPPASLGGLISTQSKALFLPFHVTWSARIKNDARFHDLKVETIEVLGNEFRAPTNDELNRYNLSQPKSS